MWIWVTLCVFFLLLVLEEFIYFFWNRFVYGPNVERKRKWWRVVVLLKRLFHKKDKKVTNTNSDKGTPL